MNETITNHDLHPVICSFCSQLLKVPLRLIGKQSKCPKCGHILWLVSSRNSIVCDELLTQWYYTLPKLIIGREEHGPIDDDHFLELIQKDVITHRSDVRSPQWTENEWFPFENIKLPLVKYRVSQRKAEQRRLREIEERQKNLENAARERLQRHVREAIADGELTLDEKESISHFAAKSNISEEALANLLATESRNLIAMALDEALEDGVLEPIEERRIGQAAKNLGCPISVTEQQRRRIELCRFAHQINTRDLLEMPRAKSLLSLGTTEVCYAECKCEWLEVVQSRKPVGQRIDDERYLKPVMTGTAYLTSKHIIIMTPLESRKARNSSVQSVVLYSDGIFLNRSTGKSVFIRFLDDDDSRWRFSLLVTRVITEDPVQGIIPERSFPIIEDDNEAATQIGQVFFDEPRFTFRVVGDHVGNRAYYISRLTIGEPLFLVREPNNPYDNNAVIVTNLDHEPLGYLKREVAEWFAPLLDSGKRYSIITYRMRDDGGLIAGVYESR